MNAGASALHDLFGSSIVSPSQVHVAQYSVAEWLQQLHTNRARPGRKQTAVVVLSDAMRPSRVWLDENILIVGLAAYQCIGGSKRKIHLHGLGDISNVAPRTAFFAYACVFSAEEIEQDAGDAEDRS